MPELVAKSSQIGQSLVAPLIPQVQKDSQQFLQELMADVQRSKQQSPAK